MVDLTLSRDAFALPPVCACCLAPTKALRLIYKRQLEKTFGKTGVRERKVRIPFCDVCTRHVDWKIGGRIFGVVLAFVVYTLLFGFLSMIIGVIWSIANDAPENASDRAPLLAMAVGPAIAAVIAGRRFVRRPRERMGAGHTAEGECVELIRFDDARIGLRIHNSQWAQRVSAFKAP